MLACALVAAMLIGLSLYCGTERVSPDGKLYLAAGRGFAVARPFHLRPVLPWLNGDRMWAWRTTSIVGVFVAAMSVGLLAAAHGLSMVQSMASTALFASLPIARSTLALPVLVDGPALALTGLSALCAVHGHIIAAALIAAVGAGVKEHVPVFAALAAWSLWPLVGVAVTLIVMAMRRPALPSHPSQASPLKYARMMQAQRLLSAQHVALPWGACLAAALAPTVPVLASLAVSYALLFVSADSTRIYQWAALPVCAAAAGAIPEAWLPVAVAAHVLNPWQGEL